MPKKALELSALQVKRLTKPGLYAIGGVDGLQLQVKESGARSWILRVKVGNRRPDIGLGGFPDVTLETARTRARETREQIRLGVDPIAARKAAQDDLKLAQAKQMSFDKAAALAHGAKSPEFKNAKHAAQWLATLKEYASPIIGSMSVDSIELANVLEVLTPIWKTKTETATRVRQRIEAVLSWATVNGYRSGPNPAAWVGNLQHALPKAMKVKRVKHHPALDFHLLGSFIKRLRSLNTMSAKALEFLILTAARSGQVREATWDEIDLDAKLWVVQAERMKSDKTHRVPLPEPALALLRALPRLDGNPIIFPGLKGRPLSDNTLSKLMHALGEVAVPHGFRTTFKDWARSSTSYADEVTELALAHVDSDATRAAYARDELLPKRQKLMRDWARFCYTECRGPASVTPLRKIGGSSEVA